MVTISAQFLKRAAWLTKSIIAAGVLAYSPMVAAEPIRGAGSTFAAPVIARWAKSYQEARADGGDFISPDWKVDYELVGSLGGLMRLDQPELDFAATDTPVSPDELAKRGQQQFPIVMGGVAIVTNLDGIGAGTLRLTGAVLADVYLGKIQNWSDPAIKASNPGLDLPNLRISVTHRKDGSGTTAVFTEFLSAVSLEWKQKYGSAALISWPLGTSAEGTQSVLRAVRATKGAIAYVEYGQVARANLPFASILNRSGQFVRPDQAGVQAAAAAVDWANSKDFFASLTNLPGEAAYPISAATFVVMPVASRTAARVGRVHDLFKLAFDKGSADAIALGYVPLPPDLVALIKQHWTKAVRVGG
jgi:phosphate transport system substrate-binding protein